jgi:hypothetical protein
MELPYQGRAIINEDFNGIEINIPPKRNWALIIFLSFWLCGWLAGECFAISSLTGVANNTAPDGFLALWLCGWTVGGFFAIRAWWWNIAGKEVINIGQGILSIDRKGALLNKIKSYDLNDTKNFRVQEDIASNGPFGGMRTNSLWKIGNVGTIRFDYGMKTIKFGEGLDEAEGFYILQKLRNKKMIG